MLLLYYSGECVLHSEKKLVSAFCVYCWRRQSMEEQVGELESTLRVGAVQLKTEQLRMALAVECSAWKQAYARQLNRHCADVMDELHKYFRVMQRRLDHPLRDLEDIRTYKVDYPSIIDVTRLH